MRDQVADRLQYQMASPVRTFYLPGPDPMESNPSFETRSCVGGCGRIPCLATNAEYVYWCCPGCENGTHSTACSSEWEYKRLREIQHR